MHHPISLATKWHRRFSKTYPAGMLFGCRRRRFYAEMCAVEGGDVGAMEGQLGGDPL